MNRWFEKALTVLKRFPWTRKFEPNAVIVRGRLRVWQFVLIGIALGLPVLFFGEYLAKTFARVTVERVCDSGPLGITVGWWYVLAVFTFIESLMLAALIHSFVLARAIQKEGRFPLPHKIPWVDTELKVGAIAIRHAKVMSIGGIVAFALVGYCVYLTLDLASSGRNMTPKEEAECRNATLKRGSSGNHRLPQ